MEWADFTTPWGRGWVACRGGAVVDLRLGGCPPKGAPRADLPIARKVERYFAGEAVVFNEPFAWPETGEFGRRVYEAVRRIPRGRTRTYGEIAREAGRPKAARAVGQFMRRNPLCLIIP